MPAALQKLQAGLGDRYSVEAEVGRGGMATVYRATERATGHAVAIKVLREDLADVLGPERFLREIAIVRQLEHPNIVPLVDSGNLEGVPYFVMPLVAGETLRQRLRREIQLPVDDAVRIACDVADGLTHAHERGIIHRDIKPENILLDGQRAVIADFGVARALHAVDAQTLSSTGIAIGTPAYMSPEQASGVQPVSARTDIYSLGCVLYEMLAGEPPFTGPTAQAIAARHMVEPPRSIAVIRSGLGDGIEVALQQALAKVPADRFPDAARFRAALLAEGVTLPSRRPARGRRRLLATLGVAVVGLVAATGYFLMSRDRPETPGTHRYLVAGFAAPFAGALSTAMTEWSGIDVVGPSGTPATDLGRVAALARRAGADRIVTGHELVVGDTTTLVATVYAGGATPVQVRRVTLRLAGSPSAAEARAMADSLLVPPRARGEAGSGVGTRSVPSLEAFADGQAAVDRWALAEADSAFGRALDLDPAFTRARVWTASVRFWQGQPSPAWAGVAARAVRDSADLGPFERLHVAALDAMAAGRLPEACRLWQAASAQRPDDFRGWFSWARCLVDDHVVVRDPRSPSGWRFRSSQHAIVVAHTRALRLKPAIYTSFRGSAFEPLRSLLVTSQTDVRSGRAAAPDSGWFSGYTALVDDTIAVTPYPIGALGRADAVALSSREAVLHQRRVFLELAQEWAAADPASPDAHMAVAVGLDMNADPAALAAIRVARLAARTRAEALRTGATEVWLRIRSSIPFDPAGLRTARLLADSLVVGIEAVPDLEPETALSLLLLVGDTDRAAIFARSDRAAELLQVPASLAREALPFLLYAASGGPADTLLVYSARVSQRINSAMAGQPESDVAQLRLWLLGRPASLVFPDVVLPAIRELAGQDDYLIAAQASLLSGDTAGAVRRLKSVVDARVEPPFEQSLDAVYSEARFLAAAGDSAGARLWIGRSLESLALSPPSTFADPARAAVLLRSVQLLRDLAEAGGQTGLAARANQLQQALTPPAGR